MDASRWTRAHAVLNDLLDAQPEDPEAWLAEHCDDPALREEVQDLYTAFRNGPLDDDAEAADWLASDDGSSPLADDLLRGLSTAPQPGDRVGRYRLVEEVGTGGMGVVYRAERADGAFEHPVAVKLLRRRLASPNAEPRFRAERQILARLDHPSIARLIDGGVTADDRPFLVMEYVDGIPLTDYADRHALSLDARLDLLLQVVDAVQAAHRRLVVHRDLKPSNVLVTDADGEPRVRLLDFGIAKLLADDGPITQPETRTGQALMTPAYAAPEQVQGAPISTAVDVYQLGVLAHALLTGAPPFAEASGDRRAVEEAVVNRRPSAPSSHEPAPGIAPGAVRHDLDMIVQKALRKEPGRRYRSADALGADLRRFRKNEPVRARPATVGYRIRTFTRRHRWGVATAAAIVLLTGLFMTALVHERNAAQRQAAKAEQVSSFLVDLFETTDPAHVPADTLTAGQLLERGKRRLPALEAQPAVQAQLLSVIGRAHRSLDQPDSATVYLGRSLSLRRRLHAAEAHPSLATGLEDVAILHRKQGRYAAAESLHREALRMREATLGPRSPAAAQSINNLAVVLRIQAAYDDADSLYQRALAIRRSQPDPDSLEIAQLLNNRGSLLHSQGRSQDAERLHRAAIAIWQAEHPRRHPHLSLGYHDLALTLEDQGRTQAADSLYRRSAALDRALFGSQSLGAAQSYNNLGILYGRQGKWAQADSFLTAALRIRTAALGPDHPKLAESYNNLARLHIETDDPAAARPLLRRALDLDRTHHGPSHPYVGGDHLNLGRTAWQDGDPEAAAGHFQEAARIFAASLPEDHPRAAEPWMVWGRMRLERGDPAGADSLLQKGLRARRAAYPADHWRVGQAQSLLGAAKTQLRAYSAADTLLRTGHHTLTAAHGPTDPRTRRAAERLDRLEDAWAQDE